MLVSEAMEGDPAIISPLATLEAAARRMRDERLHFMIVCHEGCANGQIAGVITDRDIVVRCVAEGRDGVFSRVADAMNSPAICCRDSDALEQAKELALRSGVRRLPVLDSANRVVGLFKADGKTPVEVKPVEELPRISA